MKIAVLSGKGGTGKTLVSVNLAAAADDAVYADCDVEEPNGHLFFKTQSIKGERVAVKIPQVDAERCTGCRKCVEFCRFNALAYVKNSVFVFAELCHSCGGCALLCPAGAISEKDRIIGQVDTGVFGTVRVLSGVMNTGEVTGVPIVKKLLQAIEGERRPVFIDCPPGSACLVMESIRDADYCILVAEPTSFGVHNLAMVEELVRIFNKPFGAVLNKCMPGDNLAEDFCREMAIPVLARIPYEPELGRLNSNGVIAAREKEKYRQVFSALLEKVMKEGGHEAAADLKR